MKKKPSKKAEALLAKANDVLDERGWAIGELVSYQGSHCALGAIGYARFGEQFDQAENGFVDKDAMSMLRTDPVCREAVVLLANEIRGKDGRKLIELSDPPEEADEYGYAYDPEWETVASTVVHYNDSTRSSKGIRVRNRFAKWKKEQTAKRHAKNKVTPVDHPLEVEIMGSPVVAPKQVEVTA